ncbi:hypothetical protein BH09VER1_BH09VER1_10930 [soil metagenome]
MSDKTAIAVAEVRKKLAKTLDEGLWQDLMRATTIVQDLAANLASEQHSRADEAIQLRNIVKKATDDLHAVYVALEFAK